MFCNKFFKNSTKLTFYSAKLLENLRFYWKLSPKSAQSTINHLNNSLLLHKKSMAGVPLCARLSVTLQALNNTLLI